MVAPVTQAIEVNLLFLLLGYYNAANQERSQRTDAFVPGLEFSDVVLCDAFLVATCDVSDLRGELWNCLEDATVATWTICSGRYLVLHERAISYLSSFGA